MGSGASVENKPQCPYHRMRQAQVKKATTSRYVDGEASDFYFHCANGNIDEVRKILEAPVPRPIDELVKLEPNGDTALHVAIEKGHVEIVELLLEHRCSRMILNRFGKVASEVAATPQMQRMFIRSETSGRFHDSDPHSTVSFYIPRATINETQKQFVKLFETEKDVREYSLNHQTTAMWVSFYNWFSRKFPTYFQRDNLNIETFHLDKNADFQEFLSKKMKDDKTYIETLEAFQKAQHGNSIDKLLTIYSSERLGFYKSLNQQLADSENEAYTSPHLCDRFIIEFHLRGDDLKKRSYTGIVYRGATAYSSELSVYEQALEEKSSGVIVFKSFTSTSEEKDEALEFLSRKSLENDQICILYVIEIKTKTPTIIGIADVSEYPEELEVLVMPGNLFVVKKLVKDVTVRTRNQKIIKLTEIHLEYLHTPVSLWRKLLHTYRSANNTVT